MPETKTNVGGQAVLEGVMMRSPKCFAVAVRRRNGHIVVREQPWQAALANKVAKVPFLRGAVTLFESMQNGYSALRFSAEQMEQDLAQEEAEASAAVDAEDYAEADAAARGVPHVPGAARAEKAAEAAAPAAAVNSDSGASGVGTRLATVFALLFFIGLPYAVTFLFGLHQRDVKFHVVAGAFKLLLVLGYMIFIRRVPEMKRVFQYHGAEHKAIATYEAGEALTVENARQHSTRHARCGTTFLIVVVFVSVLVYAGVIPPLLNLIGLTEGPAAFVLGFALRVLMLPVIAGVAYELQRLGARFSTNPLAKLFLTPGYWVQGITTIEPTDDQLEIALASLRITLVREAAQAAGTAQPVTEPVVQTFPSFAAFATAYEPAFATARA